MFKRSAAKKLAKHAVVDARQALGCAPDAPDALVILAMWDAAQRGIRYRNEVKSWSELFQDMSAYGAQNEQRWRDLVGANGHESVDDRLLMMRQAEQTLDQIRALANGETTVPEADPVDATFRRQLAGRLGVCNEDPDSILRAAERVKRWHRKLTQLASCIAKGDLEEARKVLASRT